MKARELISLLGKVHPETQVILSKDIEGNGFSPAGEVTEQYYIADSKWSGELVDEEYVTQTDSDEIDSVIVIWPVN